MVPFLSSIKIKWDRYSLPFLLFKILLHVFLNNLLTRTCKNQIKKKKCAKAFCEVIREIMIIVKTA